MSPSVITLTARDFSSWYGHGSFVFVLKFYFDQCLPLNADNVFLKKNQLFVQLNLLQPEFLQEYVQ